MAVTTIGPINFDINTFHSQWMKYRINLKQEQRKNNHHLQGISKVDALPQQIQNVAEFQAKRNLQEIMSLNYFKMAKEANELYSNNEYNRTLKDSVVWPGIYFAKRTMRERYSLTVTDDFFGKTEAVATIKSLYSQLGKIIIDSFAELEFDVSQYKDEKGNYTINASKIDQLFLVGDQIQFNQPQPVDKKENDNTSINNTESRDATGSRTEGTKIEATPAQ